MKKLFSIIFIFILVISLASCNMMNVLEFTEDGVTYYYEYSDGIKSITNYHPYKLWALPNYQELVQLGEGAGLENEGNVYYIYIVDTSVDPESSKAYYTAEFNAETKELLFEDGEYFSDEATKNATVERLIHIIDTAYFK